MKFLTVSIFALALCALSSCGNSQQSTKHGSATASNATDEPAIDVNAAFAGKGIGKFTQVDTPAIDPAMVKQGQMVFQNKCVSCHSPEDAKLIGPGLKNITKIRTPEWIMNFIYNSEEMTFKDPVGKQLRKEYKLPMMISGGITDEECRQVLEFLRQNDKN